MTLQQHSSPDATNDFVVTVSGPTFNRRLIKLDGEDTQRDMLLRALTIAQDIQEATISASPCAFHTPGDVLGVIQHQLNSRLAHFAAHQENMSVCIALLNLKRRHFLQSRDDLVDCLASCTWLNKQACADLRSWSPSPSSIDLSNVDAVWQMFAWLEERYRQLRLEQGYWDAAAEAKAIAFEFEKAINWLLGVIDYLNASYDRVERAHTTLAQMDRLDEDTLVLIFRLLAGSDAPTRSTLGWIRLSHVCRTWRRVLLGLSDLWARDAYVFGASIARKYILARAGHGFISVCATRLQFGDSGRLSTPYCKSSVPLLAREDSKPIRAMIHQGKLRDLHVWSHSHRPEGNAHLWMWEQTLRFKAQPYLRSVKVGVTWWNDDIQPTIGLAYMAQHPRLCHIEFYNIFIPFALSSLTSLLLTCTHRSPAQRSFPQPWINLLLLSLQACPSLEDLRIYDWLLPPSSNPRLELPRLNSLCSRDSNILGYLKLPALQHVLATFLSTRGLECMRTVLGALFKRNGLKQPRSMQIAQRTCVNSHCHQLILTFARSATNCPPAPAIPFNSTTFAHGEPGSCISMSFPIDRRSTANVISRLFPEVSAQVREVLTSVANNLEVLGLDNETRELKFDFAAQTPYQPMMLPPFPSVRTIELPLRDYSSTYHLLLSLGVDANMANLPLLGRIRFSGNLYMAQGFLGVHTALRHIVRARRASRVATPITSLEFELSCPAHTEFTFELLLLKHDLNAAVADVPAIFSFEEQYIVIPQTHSASIHLIATIVYEPTVLPISSYRF
ncbi:hypothetical protein PENSPDRAFT_755604 [Peniophora sp. CONT]|nr:hypothetical protein PENSPDRAFT_755604 [Peniophora sp. CONT]